MPRPRVYKTDAIVLRQRKLGEADKIVTLFSSYRGKVDAVAKGIRRTRSRLGGHLEPLTHGSYLLAEGRDLDIITQAETIEGFPTLRSDLERVSRGLYCAELVDRLLPDRSEANPAFRLLLATLERLDREIEIDQAVRFFEMRRLDELGYRPQLETCSVCSSKIEPVENFWSNGAGGVVGPECSQKITEYRPLTVNALKVLRLLQRASFAEVARVRIAGDLAEELEGCLAGHIEYVLERQVKSAGFVATLRRNQAPTPAAIPAVPYNPG
jgi:DNA repair protein RecO (recombination protein O)